MRDLQQDSNGGYGFWFDAFNSAVGVFSLLMSLVGIFIMTAIFKTRNFTFNLYVIFAILPDAICNGMIGVSNLYEAIYGIMPQFLCSWSIFQVIFYYHSNLYVNAVIAKEIYHLALNSYKRRRTKQPSIRRVITQMGLIYVLTGLLCFWYAAPISWSIITIRNEPCCLTDFKHSWGPIVVMVFTMPPLLYVFAIGYKVKKEKLLPVEGRTRVIALYFMRIIVIFMTFYIPMLVLANAVSFISPGPNDPIKAYYTVTLQIFRLLFPIQNIVTFKLLLEKKDISDALYDYTAKISSFFFGKPSDRDFTDPTDETSEWFLDDTYYETDDDNAVIDIEHPTVD